MDDDSEVSPPPPEDSRATIVDSDASRSPSRTAYRQAGPVRPPSIAFELFVECLDRMDDEGLPTRIDKDYFAGRSAATTSQLLAALRFFDLIDDQGQPLPRLALLADNVLRELMLRQLLEAHYVRAMGLDADTTTEDLDKALLGLGVARALRRRRAIAFFLDAANYAHMDLSLAPPERRSETETASSLPGSKEGEEAVEADVPDDSAIALGPHVMVEVQPPPEAHDVRKPSPRAVERRRARPRRAGAQQEEPRPVRPERRRPRSPSALVLPPHIVEAKRSAYADLLMELVKAGGDHPDQKLLDRVERVLGYSVDKGRRQPRATKASSP